MSKVLWLAAATMLSIGGMVWLALAMNVHWKQVMQRPAPDALRARLLPAMGTAALLASLLACLMADRPSMAALVWVMLLALAAVLVALTLTWRPRTLRLLLPWLR